MLQFQSVIYNRLNYFLAFILVLLPPALVSGPAVPDIIISLLGLFGLVFFIKRYSFFKEIKKIIFFFLFFYIYFCLNSLFSEYSKFSIESSIFYLRFLFFSLFSYLIFEKFKNRILKLFFFSALITIFIVGIDSYKQLITGVNFFGIIIQNIDRPSGLFREEYIIGSFIARNTPLLLAIYFFLFFKNKTKNIYFLITLLLIINLFVIISGERAALVLISLVDVVFFILLPIRRIYKIISVLLLFSTVSCVLIFSDVARERMINETYNQIFDGEEIYIFSKQHQSHYESAFKMFKDKPIFGQGVNTFRIYCSDEKFYINDLACSTHPHNSYVQLLAETGLIGFLFLVIVYVRSIYEFIKLIKIRNKNYIVYSKLMLFLSVIVNFFPILPSNNFFNNWINIIYFLPLGFYLYLKNK